MKNLTDVSEKLTPELKCILLKPMVLSKNGRTKILSIFMGLIFKGVFLGLEIDFGWFYWGQNCGVTPQFQKSHNVDLYIQKVPQVVLGIHGRTDRLT